ncbi:alpha/beta hydrolase [Kitasatospora sp. NPDC056184]|uniref:alpha/beta hydrolase n=1 Tax=Kitasatospora sp. NPDC056184 TaxID=3345738 RepID=UPI0035DF147F
MSADTAWAAAQDGTAPQDGTWAHGRTAPRGRIERVPGFRSELLGNERDLLVHLPPGYDDRPDADYPVLYLHDGQQVFDQGQQPTWAVDRTLEALYAEGLIPELIAVAVPNAGADRGVEYSHVAEYWRTPGTPLKGHRYEAFLTDEVKPFVDARYRTRTGPEHTALMGSSMGGLVTYHIAFRRPEVFGLAAVLSPFLAHVDPDGLGERVVHERYRRRGPRRIWLDIGGREGLIMARPARELAGRLVDEAGYTSGADLLYYEDPAAPHHENAWRPRARHALLHLFGAPSPVRSLTVEPEILLAPGETWSAVNPVAVRADGVRYTALEAGYRVERPEVAAVSPHGGLLPLAAGRTAVTVRAHGLAASTEVAVDPELPAHPVLEVTVTVPPGTPDDAPVMFGPLPCAPAGPGRFRGRIAVPRGTGFDGGVSRGWGLDAVDADGRRVLHPLRVDRDTRLDLTVDRWHRPADGI